jgi:hypothetical protein
MKEGLLVKRSYVESRGRRGKGEALVEVTLVG